MPEYKPLQIIETHPHSLRQSWATRYDDYVDVEDVLEQMGGFRGLCKYCDVELTYPVHGDPLEPANNYCPQCGWVKGEGEESRFPEYQ